MGEPSLKWNIAANMTGRLWSAVLTLISVPIFARAIGLEAYGLVSLFASFDLVFGALDLGLTPTVNREVARNLALRRSNADNAVVLRTFESVYWAIGGTIAVITLYGAHWVATEWVNVRDLPRSQVEFALRIMAVCFAIRWPVSLYNGVLQGLQQQVRQNIVLIATSSIRTLGTLGVVLWVSPTVTAFLVCQLLANTVEIGSVFACAWISLDAPRHVRRFDIAVLQRTWRFALSINVLGAVGLLVTQIDKLVISKTLPLAELGYYAIAATAAGAVPLVATSVGAGLFPRFSARTAADDRKNLVSDYHRAVQVVAFLGVAAGLAVALFPQEILGVWIRRPALVGHVARTLTLLSLASLLNALQNPAYNLLLAAGKTGFVLAINTINVCVFVPLMLTIVPVWGIEGAASVWLAQNVVFLLAYPSFARRVALHEATNLPFMRELLMYVIPGIGWLGAARLLTLAHSGRAMAPVALALGELGYLLSTPIVARNFGLFPVSLSFRWPPLRRVDDVPNRAVSAPSAAQRAL